MDEFAYNRDKKQIKNIAYFLGYAGALPFLVLSLTVLLANEPFIIIGKSALHLYGAIILSFLGGLHWGRIASQSQISSSDRWVLIYSVFPSLIGWSSYLLNSIWRESVCILITGFILAYWIDRFFVKSGKWSQFMGPLRLNLTIVACISLGLSYFAE